jgi:hypothetical protein
VNFDGDGDDDDGYQCAWVYFSGRLGSLIRLESKSIGDA